MALSPKGARTLSVLFVSSLLVLASNAPSQQITGGYATQVAALPPAASTVLVRANGDVVWFDGQAIWRRPAGSTATRLFPLPGITPFGSFLIDAGPGVVLFGENSAGCLWLVPIAGPPPSEPLCKVPLNYDAVLLAPGRALVSARIQGWSSADNFLVHVDLATGDCRTVAVVPGASGPLALASNGDVFHATASPLFPPPPGVTTILRFPRPAIDAAASTGKPLTAADAVVVWSGLDAASDLCCDDDDDLFFADWMNNAIGELNDASSATPSLAPPIVAYGSSPGANSLHFAPGPTGGGVFEPFQPTGGTLHVHETDWFSTNQVRSVAAARPTLAAPSTSSVPAGGFSLLIAGGPANAIGLLAIATGSAGGPGSIFLPGFEQPLVWNLAFATPVFVPVALDAAGACTVALTNPGFTPPLPASAQAALVSPQSVLASTTAAALLLGT